MINIDKGEFILNNGLILDSHTKKSCFTSYVITKNILKDTRDMKNSCQWFRLKPSLIFHSEMVVSVCFYNETIYEVHITNNDIKFGSSWNDWSIDKELNRKIEHDKWLYELLGKHQPYTYQWGNIYSTYDAKAGLSTIMIRFNNVKNKQD